MRNLGINIFSNSNRQSFGVSGAKIAKEVITGAKKAVKKSGLNVGPTADTFQKSGKTAAESKLFIGELEKGEYGQNIHDPFEKANIYDPNSPFYHSEPRILGHGIYDSSKIEH